MGILPDTIQAFLLGKQILGQNKEEASNGTVRKGTGSCRKGLFWEEPLVGL